MRLMILVFLIQFFPVHQLPFHLAFILGKRSAFWFFAKFQETLNTAGFFQHFLFKNPISEADLEWIFACNYEDTE